MWQAQGMFRNEHTLLSFGEKRDDCEQTTLNSNNNRFLIISAKNKLAVSYNTNVLSYIENFTTTKLDNWL